MKSVNDQRRPCSGSAGLCRALAAAIVFASALSARAQQSSAQAPGAAAAAAASGAQAPRRDLLAHASERNEKLTPVWVAMIEPPVKGGAERTRLLSREEIGVTRWRQLPDTPARIVGLTSHGTELVVMLEMKDARERLPQRNWAWFSADRAMTMTRFSYGPILPQRGRLLTLAGDSKSLYALGLAAAEKEAATRATTTPGAAATTRSVRRPMLFMLAGNEWRPLPAEWPAEASGAEELASIAVLGGVPHLAAPVGPAGNIVRVYRYVREESSGSWVPTGDEAKLDEAPRLLKLLDNQGRPGLWVQTDAVGSLWSRNHALAKIQFSGATPKASEVDVTVSTDVLLFFRRDGKWYEQHFNWDGLPVGPVALIEWTGPPTTPPVGWLTTAFMLVLAVLLVSTLLRRRSMSRDDERGEPEE